MNCHKDPGETIRWRIEVDIHTQLFEYQERGCDSSQQRNKIIKANVLRNMEGPGESPLGQTFFFASLPLPASLGHRATISAQDEQWKSLFNEGGESTNSPASALLSLSKSVCAVSEKDFLDGMEKIFKGLSTFQVDVVVCAVQPVGANECCMLDDFDMSHRRG